MTLTKKQRIAIALGISLAAVGIFVAYRVAQIERYHLKDLAELKAAGVADDDIAELVRTYVEQRTKKPRDRAEQTKNKLNVFIAVRNRDAEDIPKVTRAIMCPSNRWASAEKIDCDQSWSNGVPLCRISDNAEVARWTSFPVTEAQARAVKKYWDATGTGFFKLAPLRERNQARIDFLETLKAIDIGRCKDETLPQ